MLRPPTWVVLAVVAPAIVLLQAAVACQTDPTSTPTPTPTSTPTSTPAPRPTAAVVTPNPSQSTKTLPLTWSSRAVEARDGFVGRLGFDEAWYSFDMEATFHNQSADLRDSDGGNSVSYGFYFHHRSDSNISDVIVVTSEGKWEHRITNGHSVAGGYRCPSYSLECGGVFDARILDGHEDGSNKLKLTVYDVGYGISGGILHVNGNWITEVSVTSLPRGSGLGVVTCLFDDQCYGSVTVKVTDFSATRKQP